MFLLLALLLGATCDPILHSRRIINGEESSEGQFPSTVAVMKRNYNNNRNNNVIFAVCAGVAVGQKTVATAAHCVNCTTIEEMTLVVRFGSIDLKMAQERRVEQVKCAAGSHDIALLLLDQPFPKEIPVIEIPTGTNASEMSCQVAGWGQWFKPPTGKRITRDTIVSCARNCKQRYTTLDILPREECRKRLLIMNTKDLENDGSQFCTMTNNTDTCFGDSGAPYYCNGQVYGLVSYGKGCALEGVPAVNIWLPFFKEWVESEVADWEKKAEPFAISSLWSNIANTYKT